MAKLRSMTSRVVAIAFGLGWVATAVGLLGVWLPQSRTGTAGTAGDRAAQVVAAIAGVLGLALVLVGVLYREPPPRRARPSKLGALKSVAGWPEPRRKPPEVRQ